MDVKRFNSIGDQLQKTYGCKVYKLALESGCTCPNRDGTRGYGGCSFCSAGGSGEFAAADIESAVALINNKAGGRPGGGKALYIPYFQSFSATYAPADELRARFSAAINHPLAAELAVATRPDCIGDDVLALLEELARIKPVTVELGLQTADDGIAAFHNRCCETELYREAAKKLKDIGVKTVMHLIVGLPCPESFGSDPAGYRLKLESRDSLLNTAGFIADSGASGIKIHLLQVLKGTELEKRYLRGEFRTLSIEEYANSVCDIIEHLPPELVIHRVTGDPPKKLLTAPLWCADKKRALNTITKTMSERNIFQGKNRPVA